MPEDVELLARQIRACPDDELGRYRRMAPELWAREISHRWPGKTAEELKPKAAPVVPPVQTTPQTQPASISRETLNGLTKGIAKAMKEYISEQLAPLRQRIEELEQHGEELAKQIDGLNVRLAAKDSNERREYALQ